MQTELLIELIEKIKKIKSETQIIEIKSALKGCPTKLFDTISSFANQDDGGTIIFGMDETDNFTVCGVYDAQDLQKRVTEQCKQMEPVVRPLFTVCEYENKTVVSAEIPGAEIASRPVYYKGAGMNRGSYVRVGESDELMNDFEIFEYLSYKNRVHGDMSRVPASTVMNFDNGLLEKYISASKTDRVNLSENVSDSQLLEDGGITESGVPTVAGIMTFCRFPQKYFRNLCIYAVSVPGTEMGETGENGERFLDNIRIKGSIPVMLDNAVEFVRRNSRTKTIIDENGKRTDKPEYPVKAVREAVLNALVHRDYSAYSESMPITIEMYRDRMEITNPGGIFGMKSVGCLGKIRTETRNEALSEILEMLKITENRYSGIPTMRRECEMMGLPAPEFTSLHNEFKVVLYNSYYKPEKEKYKYDSIVEFCSVPRTRDEIIGFTGKSRTYTMINIVGELLKEGKLIMTMPEKPKSSKQKYLKASESK